MTRIDFYHLQKQSLEEVLPKLLQKAYALGKRILLKIGTPERVEFLNSELWTFADDSFLPHGSKKDGFAAQQPIWLTSDSENPNNAELLVLVDGAEIEEENLNKFVRVLNVFDGNSDEAINQARRLWKMYRDGGHEVYYWQQNTSGKWEQKA